MTKEERVMVQQLFDALSAAEGHLEYTGYGDSWERGCALDGKDPLDKKIEAALAVAKIDGFTETKTRRSK